MCHRRARRRGAVRALCGDACALRELKLDGNDDIPPHLLEEIHRHLLRGALRSRLDAALRRPPPTTEGADGDDEPSLAPRTARTGGRAASLEVRERWLGDEHAADVVAAAAAASPPVHAPISTAARALAMAARRRSSMG